MKETASEKATVILEASKAVAESDSDSNSIRGNDIDVYSIRGISNDNGMDQKIQKRQ